jgi:hypothetical protein
MLKCSLSGLLAKVQKQVSSPRVWLVGIANYSYRQTINHQGDLACIVSGAQKEAFSDYNQGWVLDHLSSTRKKKASLLELMKKASTTPTEFVGSRSDIVRLRVRQ